MLVFIEPEAQDYWLRPGESIEIRAEVASSEDDFILKDKSEGSGFLSFFGCQDN